MKNYTIIIEKTATGFSAYVPDLPGCITVGDTHEETKAHMKEAIELYIEELKSNNMTVPEATTKSDIVSV
ncbi:MAG: type II toxin-antitoxin system HicB family antitoxin [Thiohalospira sp.]